MCAAARGRRNPRRPRLDTQRPAMKPLRTFVEFIIPHKKIPAGSAIVHEVKDRDIAKLDIPPNAAEFYFFDSPTDSADPYDAQNDQFNCSAFYIVAARVVTRDEADKLRKKPRPPRGKDAHKIVALGKTSAELQESFWQVSLKMYSHFAVTRTGGITPIRADNIVINEKGEQLYPKPPATKTERDIALLKMPAVKRRAP